MRKLFATSAVLLLTLTGHVLAQEPASTLPGLFTEVLDVRVINLEVIVTDKDGTPIGGLGAGDFRLLVDGDEVPIDYFTEVRGGVALSGPSSEDVRGVPSVAPGEPVGTSYLVFIDEFFSIARDRDTVVESLMSETIRMQPEDRMAVVAFDGKDVEMLSSWTSSSAALERVFESALERPAYGLHRLLERRQFEIMSGHRLDDLVRFGAADADGRRFGRASFSPGLDPQEKVYLGRLSEQLNRSVAAATATLRSFAMPPGRKVMILLSGGWPFIPSDYVVGDLSRVLVGREGPYGSNLYGRLAETANLLGYTLYPVDVPGLDREFPGGADKARLPNRSPFFDTGFIRETGIQSTLEYLARETGGRALINAERTGAFRTVVADTRSYYWLGFSPRRGWDDERHDVQIELGNPEFRTRLRSGFLDSSRGTEVNMAVESALLFGSGSTSEELRVVVGEPLLAEDRRMEVPIKISFALDQVVFVPIGEEYVTQLELRVAVLDESGKQAPVPVIPMALRLAQAPRSGARGTYETKLLLRRLPHQIVVAVHDPVSGRILTSGFDIVP